jgi:hypothetical protein
LRAAFLFWKADSVLERSTVRGFAPHTALLLCGIGIAGRLFDFKKYTPNGLSVAGDGLKFGAMK